MLAAIAFEISLFWFIGQPMESTSDDDSETSVFCHGRLLHDVQVRELFSHPRDFLELWSTQPSQVIAAKYREIRPKLKLKEKSGRDVLKGFIKENFVNRSCYELVPPPDWSVILPFDKKITSYRTYEFMRMANRQWTSSRYNMTAEARKATGLHASLPTRHPFYGSKNSFDYTESWWLFQGLVASGMLTSAKQLIENLCGLVEDFGHVPMENRAYFVGRSGPPFLAVMLEEYFNLTGDSEFVGRLLPLAEIDFHSWVHLATKKVLSAWDVFLVVSNSTFYPTKPRPERYLEDWKRKNFSDFGERGISIPFLIWDSDPPRGVVSVMLTSVTEWAARALSRMCTKFGGTQRAPVYKVFSKELTHTLNVLLYSRKFNQWTDYTSRKGHVGPVSLWPVYTGAHQWQDHYQVPMMSTLEEVLVAVDVLQKAGKTEEGWKLTSAALSELSSRLPLSLKDAATTAALISRFPDAVVTGVVPPSVHTRIALIAVPMLVTTLVFIPFIFLKVHISG